MMKNQTDMPGERSTETISMKLKVRYFRKCVNWGDALNPYLLKKLTASEIEPYSEAERDIGTHLLAVGSVLHWATPDSVIWGTGAISATTALACAPKQILAVRGPLTQAICSRDGIACPTIYGDPALLMPTVYRPACSIEHPIGIIPHYVDKDSAFVARCRDHGLTVIDVLSDVEHFVDQVVRCSGILSSSLHGLICADAYGVPSRWIQISDRVLGKGFKFRDYYASLGVDEDPVHVDSQTSFRTINKIPRPRAVPVDLDALRQVLLNFIETNA